MWSDTSLRIAPRQGENVDSAYQPASRVGKLPGASCRADAPNLQTGGTQAVSVPAEIVGRRDSRDDPYAVACFQVQVSIHEPEPS